MKIRPKPGQVFVCRDKATRTPSRRVVAIVDGKAQGMAPRKVCYSTGGDKPRWCQWRAFRLWIHRYNAVASRTRRPRTLVLRAGDAR